jgi:hypothetical protein
MIDRTEIERAEEFSPDRCQGITSNGQCLNKSYPGSNYCLVHGGNKKRESDEKEALKNYRLTKYKVELAKKRNSSYIRDLRDEIAILRVLLEEKMNGLNNTNELILASGAIGILIMQIEKLVTSSTKLEQSLSQLIDKSRMIQYTEQIINIVSKYTETEKLEKIVNEIEEIFVEEGA